MAETAALLVDDVLPYKPIRQWVLSFPYPLRFLLSSNPLVMSKVLGIVNRVISTHLIKKAGVKATQAQTGAVTLIQRFGSALNLNVHFHMLFIDGAYQEKHNGQLRFHRVNAPTASELNTLVAAISQRVAGHLERQGLLVRDDESSYLTLDLQDDDAMHQLQEHSITYRIAVGPQQGRKVFTLQTIPSWEDDDFGTNQVGKIAGFSLHAGVATKTRERKKLERLCRYISRPAVSEKRLALTSQGKVRYQLKTPYRDGSTHVIFEPLDFMAKLAALVPKPRANLTRYHGVLAPNSKQRIFVTPAKRGKGNTQKQGVKDDEPALVDCHQSMTWAERLKRVFNIDVTICSRCGGAAEGAAGVAGAPGAGSRAPSGATLASRAVRRSSAASSASTRRCRRAVRIRARIATAIGSPSRVSNSSSSGMVSLPGSTSSMGQVRAAVAGFGA